jgi:short-subunit dehydrogenase involved in D-alanine esterification of teichoic acids
MAPSLASLRASNTELVGKLPGKPVAVFVGGTSGIGQGMAETFAEWRQGRAHIVIVGRNEAAAKDIISQFPKVPASEQGQWSYEFVKCDATLMKEVKKASEEILSRHPKVNFLVMSQGFFSMSGRDETEEGLDKKLAVHYYSRWKFTEQLLPGLKAAKDQGEEARVISVFSTGYGGKIDVDDLGLKKKYSLNNAALSAATYNDYLVEVRFYVFSTLHAILTRPSLRSPLPSAILTSRSRTHFPEVSRRTSWLPHNHGGSAPSILS